MTYISEDKSTPPANKNQMELGNPSVSIAMTASLAVNV